MLIENEDAAVAPVKVFRKEYSDESLVDLPEDVSDAVSLSYGEVYADLPEDEDGFKRGTFTVTITWNP